MPKSTLSVIFLHRCDSRTVPLYRVQRGIADTRLDQWRAVDWSRPLAVIAAPPLDLLAESR